VTLFWNFSVMLHFFGSFPLNLNTPLVVKENVA